MDGTLGSRTAWLLDGSGVAITSGEELAEIVRAGAAAGLAGRGARDRRPREPRGARRVRGRPAELWAPLGLRQRIEHAQCLRPERHAALRPRSASRARCSSPRAVRPRPRGAVLGRPARRDVRVPVARGRAARVVANGSDAPVEELDPLAGIAAGVRRTIDERPPWRPERGRDDRAGAPGDRRSRPPGSRATSAAAARCCRGGSPTSSCSTATRRVPVRRSSGRRGRRDDGRRTLGAQPAALGLRRRGGPTEIRTPPSARAAYTS